MLLDRRQRIPIWLCVCVCVCVLPIVIVIVNDSKWFLFFLGFYSMHKQSPTKRCTNRSMCMCVLNLVEKISFTFEEMWCTNAFFASICINMYTLIWLSHELLFYTVPWISVLHKIIIYNNYLPELEILLFFAVRFPHY